MENKSSCTKTQLFIETLTERNLTVALRETEFEFQDEEEEFSNFG